MELEEIEERLHLKLQAWQREVVLEETAPLIMRCGRKSGKTTAMAVKIVYEAMRNPDWKVCILSKGQRQSSEVFDTVLGFLTVLGAEFDGQPTKTKIILANGHKIYSLPTGYTGVTLRTYSFHKIYYDEAAYIPDQVYDATTPCLAVHGIQKILGSTPFGAGGFFYDEWHNPDFKRWHVKTSQAPHVTTDFLKKERRRMPKYMYMQEYEAEFTEQANAFFSGRLIRECMRPLRFEDYASKGVNFLGCDVARYGRDDSVIVWCNWHEKKMRIIRAEVFKGREKTTAIAGRLIFLKRTNPNIRKIIIDEGGVGGGVVDMVAASIGKRAVLGIQNQQRGVDDVEGRRKKIIKEDLYSNLLRFMETGEIEIVDDRQILRSLASITYEYTKSGNFHISGRNDHIAEALVRSVFPFMDRKPGGLWIAFEAEKPLLSPQMIY